MSLFSSVSINVWIIIGAAVATYMTRVGGHMVLSRFERIPARLEAALNAVPAAVLTTLVAPAFAFNGPVEVFTMVVCLLVGLRFPLMAVFLFGWVLIVVLRASLG